MPRPTKKQINQVCRKDLVIAKLIKERGFKLLRWSGGSSFSFLAHAIVGQQVSTAAASTIWGRLVDRGGSRGKLTPLSVTEAPLSRLKKAGLSRQKASYIKGLGKLCIRNPLSSSSLSKLSNVEALAQLTSIKGVGVWTAQMFLIFKLGREEVLATGDVGLQNGIKLLYGLRKPPSKRFWAKADKNWSPIQASVSRQIWQFYDEAK